MIIASPFSNSINSFAASTLLERTSSVESNTGNTLVYTPQLRANLRPVFSSGANAKIKASGFKLLITRAVWPVIVGAQISLDSNRLAASTTPLAIAAVTYFVFSCS